MGGVPPSASSGNRPTPSSHLFSFWRRPSPRRLSSSGYQQQQQRRILNVNGATSSHHHHHYTSSARNKRLLVHHASSPLMSPSSGASSSAGPSTVAVDSSASGSVGNALPRASSVMASILAVVVTLTMVLGANMWMIHHQIHDTGAWSDQVVLRREDHHASDLRTHRPPLPRPGSGSSQGSEAYSKKESQSSVVDLLVASQKVRNVRYDDATRKPTKKSSNHDSNMISEAEVIDFFTRDLKLSWNNLQKQQSVNFDGLVGRANNGNNINTAVLSPALRRLDNHRVSRSIVNHDTAIFSRTAHAAPGSATMPWLFQALRDYQQQVLQSSKGEVSDRTSALCWLPRANITTCHEQEGSANGVVEVTVAHNYRMLVTATPRSLHHLRVLFLNILQWTSKPMTALSPLHAESKDVSVPTEIWIFLPHSTEKWIRQDVDYGYRLLHWDQSESHPVNVVFATTLWKAVQVMELRRSRWHRHDMQTHFDDTQTKMDRVESQAVVWINGNIPWQRNRASLEHLQQAFDLWKSRASTLVTTHGWEWSALNSNASLWVVELDGLFHHSGHLCWLERHPMLRKMRSSTGHYNNGHDDEGSSDDSVDVVSDPASAADHPSPELAFELNRWSIALWLQYAASIHRMEMDSEPFVYFYKTLDPVVDVLNHPICNAANGVDGVATADSEVSQRMTESLREEAWIQMATAMFGASPSSGLPRIIGTHSRQRQYYRIVNREDAIQIQRTICL